MKQTILPFARVAIFGNQPLDRQQFNNLQRKWREKGARLSKVVPGKEGEHELRDKKRGR